VRPTDCVILLREVNTLNVSTRSTKPDLLTHDIRVIEFSGRRASTSQDLIDELMADYKIKID
jgi:hypothetical protein